MILSLSGRINRFIAILFLVVVPFTQTARPTRRPHIPGEVPQWTVPRPVQSPRIVPLDGIRPDRHTYIDTLGRERYFRGLNVVMKGAPWHPRIDAYDSWDSFSKEDVEYLAYLNINLIRLGVMWPGVEPQRGVYNITYLGVMAKIVEMCREKGIYVLIDFHQDDLSEKLCGEGIPNWATDTSNAWFPFVHPTRYKFPFPFSMTPFSNYSSDGIPSREECVTMDWPLYQLTVEGARAYQNLYDNHNGLRDSWAAYWGVLASNFSHFENLFGYDLMNEPFAGDIYRNPLLLFPGVADRLNLQQFYESANTEIRKFDKKSIVMFEGLTWDNFRIGFTDVPGGNSFRNRTGLSYHFYPSGPYLFRMAGTFRERLADAKRLGCGLLMTEFDGPNSYASQWDIVEMADNFLQSWTTWQYKPFVDVTGSGDDVINQTTGAPREDRVRFYSRTFPHAIQGTLIQGSIFLNRTDGTFRMKFHGDPRVKGRTEIRVHPEIWYPNGLLVNVNPSSKITAYYNATLNPSLIELGLTTEALLDDEISIEIIPKLRPPRDDGVKPPDDP